MQTSINQQANSITQPPVDVIDGKYRVVARLGGDFDSHRKMVYLVIRVEGPPFALQVLKFFTRPEIGEFGQEVEQNNAIS